MADTAILNKILQLLEEVSTKLDSLISTVAGIQTVMEQNKGNWQAAAADDVEGDTPVDDTADPTDGYPTEDDASAEASTA